LVRQSFIKSTCVYTNRKTDSLFLYYWFAYNTKKIEGLGNGSTVMGISLGDLRDMDFFAVPLEEQQSIARVLSDMSSEIEQLEEKLLKLRNLKQGMMQNLLTGKIRLI
jgi:type I restriction enzyme, S subunit